MSKTERDIPNHIKGEGLAFYSSALELLDVSIAADWEIAITQVTGTIAV